MTSLSEFMGMVAQQNQNDEANSPMGMMKKLAESYAKGAEQKRAAQRVSDMVGKLDPNAKKTLKYDSNGGFSVTYEDPKDTSVSEMIRTVGNSLVKYDPVTGQATPIYTGQSTDKGIYKSSSDLDGNINVYKIDPATDTVKQFPRSGMAGVKPLKTDEPVPGFAAGTGKESAPAAKSMKTSATFSPGVEKIIKENMKAHGKTRSEVVSALKRRGYIK